MVDPMETTLTTHLVTLADAYMAATGMSSATLSERAGGDWQFFDKVRDGRLNWRIRTYDRAVGWFSDNWPDGLDWPADVPRPCGVTEEKAA
jgi:hypothetical protein